MRLFRNIIPAIGFVCLLSCNQEGNHYPEKRDLTDAKGLPLDSLAYYFSPIEPFDSSQLKFARNPIFQNDLSANLYAFKEPILYNAYLGKEHYRFLWLRSFHPPMVFTIANDQGNVTLTTKKLDRYPKSMDMVYVNDPESDSAYRAMGYQITKETDTLENGKVEVLTKVMADRRAEIIYNSTKALSLEVWNHFKRLLDDAHFWNLPPWQWRGDADGATWMFEANTKHGYKYVGRQSPGGKVRDIGVFLINLSGLKEEIY